MTTTLMGIRNAVKYYGDDWAEHALDVDDWLGHIEARAADRTKMDELERYRARYGDSMKCAAQIDIEA